MVKKIEALGQHVTSEDQLFLEKAWEWLQRVENQYVFVLTDFLNPHQISLVKNLASDLDGHLYNSADIWATEQARLILAPPYYQLDPEDFQMALLEITFSNQFGQLTHPQVLGALLHQTGLDRRVFGDILISQERVQVFVEKTFCDLIGQSVSKIGRMGVSIRPVAMDQMIFIREDYKRKTIFVDSLRLDRLIASAFNLGRNKAVQMIRANRIRVNYQERINPSLSLQEGDQISIRGKGRVWIENITGQTKSGKIKVEIKILARK